MKKLFFIKVFLCMIVALALVAGAIAAQDITTSPTPTSNASPNQNVTAGAPPEATEYAADWPMPNKDFNNSRASMDSTITSANVKDLAVAWTYNITGIGTYGGGASNPVIVGDTVYFQDLKANVIAFDLKNGSVKWMKEFNASFVEGPNGPTVGWGKVFIAKDAYNMTALDAETGEELWSTQLSNIATTGIDIAPAAYGGMVYTSTVPGTGDLFYAPGGIGVIYALDQENGTVMWNVSTVDSPDLWGHPEVNSGGGCWYTPAIDTATGSMYWAIANPAPFPGTPEWPNGSSRPGPNLYTNSMMALDHQNGDMEWFTQVNPHDLFDYDLQIAPILTTANISGKEQPIVLGAGKMGTVFAFNRETGALLWALDVGRHNGNDTLIQLPPGMSTMTEPAAIGGVETPMAYADGVLYVPVINMFTNWTPEALDLESFDISTGTGELVAIDVNLGKKLWIKPLDAINVGSTMVVNDLVFTATFDGTIYAFNRSDGEELWTYEAPAEINGWPAVAGDTIVWPAGGGGALGIRMNQTPTLLAFSLSAAGGNQTVTPTATPTATPTGGNMTMMPNLTIDEPEVGDVYPPGPIPVEVTVTNFTVADKQGQAAVTGEGHIHYYLDVSPIPTTAGVPAIPVDASAIWAHVSGTNYTFENVTPGVHNITVQLVNNDHTPLIPLVYQTVNVTVEAANVTMTPTPTATATTAPVTTTMTMTTAPTATATTTTGGGGTATVALSAQSNAFDTSSITVPAGAQVTVNFNNMDSGIPHNFAVYTSSSATTTIFRGQVITGPNTVAYTFTAPTQPGTYFFRCDVHRTVMTGQFIVQ